MGDVSAHTQTHRYRERGDMRELSLTDGRSQSQADHKDKFLKSGQGIKAISSCDSERIDVNHHRLTHPSADSHTHIPL